MMMTPSTRLINIAMPRLIHLFDHVMTSSSTHKFWSHDRLEKHHFGIELISGNFVKFDFRKKISFWVISNHFDQFLIRSDNRKPISSTLTLPKITSVTLRKIFLLQNNFEIKIFVIKKSSFRRSYNIEFRCFDLNFSD